MKKLFFTFATLFVGITLCAQNFQLHYDFGRRIYSDEEATRQNITPSPMSSSKLISSGHGIGLWTSTCTTMA